MTKKNEKRLCWNCEGEVSHHLTQCPYCGVDASQPVAQDEHAVFKGFGSPFQTSPKQDVPRPPYARAQTNDFAASDEEWKASVNSENEPTNKEAPLPVARQQIIALLLLLPGIVFFLFGIALVFFSRGGVLTLQWNQNVAYFYFLGAIPLVYLGYRALGNKRPEG